MTDGDTAVSLNGTGNQYGQVPDGAGLNPSGSLTIELWVKLNNVTSRQRFVSKGSSPAFNGYGFGLESNGHLKFSLFGVHDYPSSTTISASTWTYAAVVFTGTAATFYVNGVRKDTQAYSASMAQTTAPVLLGKWSHGEYMSGALDDVAIYNAALNDSQIATHFTDAGLSNGPPVNVTRPSVAGIPIVGQSLTAQVGAWSGNPSYAYQWQECDSSANCADVSGATSSTYSLGPSDVGSALQIVVTATNQYGSTSATSAPSAPVLSSAAFYPQAVLADSPSAYWRLGERAGSSLGDTSSHSHSGAYIGPPTMGVSNPNMTDGDTAVSFDGTGNQYGQVPDGTGLNPSGGLTIELWAKLNNVSSRQRFISKSSAPSPYNGYGFGLESNGALKFSLFGVADYTSPANAFPAATWTFLAVTFDGSAAKFYVDGAPIGNVAATHSVLSTAASILIGK